MGLSAKSRRKADKVAELSAQIEALQARLENLERPSSNGHPNPSPAEGAGIIPSPSGGGQGGGSQSRRDLLKLAGAAAAGAAGSIVLGAVPAAATNGQPILLGNSTTNDAATTTTIFPTTATTPAPLFEGIGQSVTGPTTVPPTVSTTGPAAQSIPVIGAIGPGGSLPLIGSPGVNDYPGFAPIQGVGGDTTVGGVHYSEGVNGWGVSATGIGVSGESDVGYGVVGGSGGISLAAFKNGRIMQEGPQPSMLASAPAGPPIYQPNDFEQVRDLNGLMYLSLIGQQWVPVQFGGLGVSLFSAVSNLQYHLNGSDGAAWMDMDASVLKLSFTPKFNCIAILTANSDLWTTVPGWNQDMGIFVSGGTYASGQIVGWKESGGVGAFSPNAAFLETLIQLAAGTTYTIKIQWKTNRPAPASTAIYAGAGGGPPYSPTRLTALLMVNPT